MTTGDRAKCFPPANLALTNAEVHVWRAPLDMPTSRSYLWDILAPDELDRAQRFHRSRDRQRFVVARGLLRIILGRYLHMEPGQLCFGYGDYGKPYVAAARGQMRLEFNVSHSDGLALYAVTCDREIGVDLERIHPVAEAEQIAERFFSAREHAVFRALPADRRQEAFFTCWTRKEAYIKARGKGLSLPLDRFDVSLDADEPVALLSVRGDPRETGCWSLRDLRPGPGYVAALAVEGQDWDLACWQFPESTFGLWNRLFIDREKL